MNSRNLKTKTLCRSAVITALIFVVTRFIQIPIPLGYLNIGNTIILIGCLLLPYPYGIFAASLGSCLADLTSFAAYALPTLLIKAVFPLVFYLIIKGNSRKWRKILAAVVSTLIPLAGYTVTGMILYGGIAAGLVQVPGLLIEYVLNIVLFIIGYGAICKIHFNFS